MSYTISRESAERDWDALRAILDNDGIVGGDVVVLEQIAKSIRAQIPKPAVAEPTELFSVVHASDAEGRTFNAVRVYEGAKRPWNSGAAWYGWWELHDPEVLRVGIGEPQPRPVEELVGVLTDPNWGQANAYQRGRTDFAEAMRRDLSALRAEALSAERKDAYDKALALVAALLGES